MQNRVKILGCLSLAVLLSGCLGWKKDDKSEQTQQSAVRLINVLDEKFFNDAHISGSLNIGLDDLEKETATWDKTNPIVVYCANYQCSASAAAVRKLMALGFTNVKAYEAGMAGWMQAGLPVDGDAQEAYLTQPNEKIEHDDAAEAKSESCTSDACKADHDATTEVPEITTEELATVLGVVPTTVEVTQEVTPTETVTSVEVTTDANPAA